MLNGSKRLFGTIASSILLSASGLAASPAAAQAGGAGSAGGPSGNDAVCCATWGCTPPGGAGICCVYDPSTQNWYRYYVWGYDFCDPYLGATTQSDHPSLVRTEPTAR